MRILLRQIGLLSLSAAYWLTVTLAPVLHQHSHHAGEPFDDCAASHNRGHHHHAPRARCGHSECSHSQSATSQRPNQQHTPHDPHQHDDDCGACRFLAMKPAPAAAVVLVVLSESLPQELVVSVPAVGGVAPLLPFSRGPPRLV